MQIVSATFPGMGTQCEVVLVASQEKPAKLAIQAVAAEVARLEKKYSRYRPDSLVSTINRAAGSGQRTEIDSETAWLMSFANALHQESDGLFDLTSGKLSRAWDWQKKLIPSTDEIQRMLSLVGWSKVELSQHSIYLPIVGMEIDFGGIGKEYAADCAAKILKKRGFNYGYINFGGDIAVLGPQPDGSPWQLGVRDPNQPEGIIASIPLRGGALTTSGDYERFFEINGNRYTHIIHPKTGMPVSFSRSISVIATETIYAGSCSTIAMLMDDPEQFLSKCPIKYLIVKSNGSIYRN